MAIKVITDSGSEYLLDNGRVTRIPVFNPYLAPECQIVPIERECFTFVRFPLVIGRPMILQIAGKGPLVSTPVREIVPL